MELICFYLSTSPNQFDPTAMVQAIDRIQDMNVEFHLFWAFWYDG